MFKVLYVCSKDYDENFNFPFALLRDEATGIIRRVPKDAMSDYQVESLIFDSQRLGYVSKDYNLYLMKKRLMNKTYTPAWLETLDTNSFLNRFFSSVSVHKEVVNYIWGSLKIIFLTNGMVNINIFGSNKENLFNVKLGLLDIEFDYIMNNNIDSSYVKSLADTVIHYTYLGE